MPQHLQNRNVTVLPRMSLKRNHKSSLGKARASRGGFPKPAWWLWWVLDCCEVRIRATAGNRTRYEEGQKNTEPQP